MGNRAAIAGVLLTFAGSACVEAQALLPKPTSVERATGEFKLSGPVWFVRPNSKRMLEIVSLLSDDLRWPGSHSNVLKGRGNVGAIQLDTSLQSGNPEAYELTISPTGIRINGATIAGTFWGVQTLRQLLADSAARGSVPAVTIRDAPRFSWRGSMLDVSRHFLPVAAVKKHIDLISRYKLNVLHWHLTDDQGWRIEIKKYPKLTSVGAWRTESDGSRYGGFYTQADIRDVVEYARLRGVTVVPEIEMPGHSSAALAAYPELGCTGAPVTVPTTWGVFSDIYCARPRTIEFLENVLTEVLALFPSKYIHVGGDEVPKERWKQCADCQELMKRENIATEAALQSWFVKQIGDWLNARGRKLIGWDEVLQGGLMPGATVEAWEDTSFTRKAIEAGHDVIAAPDGFTYLNSSPGALMLDKVYGWNPVPTGVDSLGARRVLGGEAPLWSERILSPTNLQLMAFPRTLALAEVLWSGAGDVADFHRRVESQSHWLATNGVAVGPADKDIATIRIEYDTARHQARTRIETNLPGVVVRQSTNGFAPTATSPTIADSAPIVGAGVHRLQAFYNGQAILGDRQLTVANNKALGKLVRVTPNPRGQYQGTGPGSLTDGLLGSEDHADGVWQGWLGRDVEAIVYLERAEPIDTIRVNFLGNVRSWIMMPPEVDFAISDDGSTWTPVGEVPSKVPPEKEGAIIQTFAVALKKGTTARYVRVIAKYAGPLPPWHPGAGRPSFLFADEIVIR